MRPEDRLPKNWTCNFDNRPVTRANTSEASQNLLPNNTRFSCAVESEVNKHKQKQQCQQQTTADDVGIYCKQVSNIWHFVKHFFAFNSARENLCWLWLMIHFREDKLLCLWIQSLYQWTVVLSSDLFICQILALSKSYSVPSYRFNLLVEGLYNTQISDPDSEMS